MRASSAAEFDGKLGANSPSLPTAVIISFDLSCTFKAWN
ncbi:MAG: hypothetical protein ACI9I0_002656, partial [Rhodoferax sp.]